MDFDKIIYVILFLVIFLYRQYRQFGKKERKEMGDDASPSPEQARPARPKKSLKELLEELTEEPKPWEPQFPPVSKPLSPHHESNYAEPAPAEEKRVEEKYVAPGEQVTKEEKYVPAKAPSVEEVEEVAHAKSHRIVHTDYSHEESQHSHYADLDLRDAVIKSVILQRPEW
jgi:hypothetical protein